MEFRPQGPWCFHPSHVGIPDSIRASAEPSRGGSEPEPVPLSDVGTLGCLTGPRVHHPSSIYGVGLQPYLLRYLDSKLTSNTFLRSYRLEPGHRVTGVTGQSTGHRLELDTNRSHRFIRPRSPSLPPFRAASPPARVVRAAARPRPRVPVLRCRGESERRLAGGSVFGTVGGWVDRKV